MLSIFLFMFVLTCYATPKDSSSDKDHFEKINHTLKFDQEAFLGKDEAKRFDQFNPTQIKEELRKLFPKVDGDADNLVTEDELTKWMQHTQDEYLQGDYIKQMKENDLDKDGYVTWEEYKKVTSAMFSEDEGLLRDEKRFKFADKEGDMKLQLDEFSAFLHPEKHARMKEIIIDESLEDLDKDKDGFLSLEEYIGDILPEADRAKQTEPEWVKSERKQFRELHDKNKDGKLDREELVDWAMPSENEHVISEAKHLVSESDTNGDGKISEEEMVEKYDLFVNSQATDFGEILKPKHEEL